MSWIATATQVSLAFKIAKDSPDPYMKVGAVGFDIDGQVVATGFNRTNPFVKAKFWKDREGRRPFMIHGEQMLVANLRIHNFIEKTEARPMVYVMINLMPCVQCMNLLAVFEVQKVCFCAAYEKDHQAIKVAKWHGIELERVHDYGNKFIFIQP